MFDDKFFDDWLDSQAQKVMEQVASGQSISSDQMMILMLKAQTNHFAHLDVDLRSEMKALREDMDKRFEQMQIETVKRFEQVDRRFEQVDKRFEQMQIETVKRFEQVDKRFEQMQAETTKRFDQLTSRMDHFMIWSFATTLTVGGIVIAAIKFL
jgi:predicted nuclease with TOPRIM domain